MDTLTSTQRSARMALVRGRDTKPELRVRRALTRHGLRYRLHAPGLPGRPDIVIPARKLAIFVHGCFWHRHTAKNCKLARTPKSRPEFWLPKFEGNRVRDRRCQAALRRLGWRVFIVWECRTLDDRALESGILRILRGAHEVD